MKNINLSTIVIPNVFLKSKPKKEKLEKVKNYFRKYGSLDKPLIVMSDTDLTLTDNYIRYVIAKELGITSVPCMTVNEYRKYHPDENQTMTYVVGVFSNRQKEYTWMNPKNIPVEIDDKVIVRTKDKKKNKNIRAVVTVVDVYKSNNPNLLRHKSIIKVIKKEEN